MGPKRKIRSDRDESPTGRKRKIGGTRQGNGNGNVDTDTGVEATEIPSMDEPQVKVEDNDVDNVMVELDSELEPPVVTSNQQEFLSEFSNEVPDVNNGQVQMKLMRHFKDELQIENEESEMTSGDPKAVEGLHANARAATVECDNFGATEEGGGNTDDSFILTYWKLMAKELANQKLKLENRAYELETKLLLQKLESDRTIWDLNEDLAKRQAKDLERNFREDKSTMTNPDPKAEGLHTAASSCKSLVLVSTTKSQNDTATGEGHNNEGKENSGDTSSWVYLKIKVEEMINQKLEDAELCLQKLELVRQVRDLEGEMAIQKLELDNKARDLEAKLRIQKLEMNKKVRDIEAEMAIQKREFVKNIRDLKVEMGYWKGTAKEVESKVLEMERKILYQEPVGQSLDENGTGRVSLSETKASGEMEVEVDELPSEFDCVVDMAEDNVREQNSSQVIGPEGMEHPSREISPSSPCLATRSESEITSREPRSGDIPTTASGSKTSKSTVGSTKCENPAPAPTGTGGLDNNKVDGSSINGSSDVNLNPLLYECNETRPKDFSVVSKGYCFLCFKKISPSVDISSSSVTSFEDISRYLKIDMRKVFIQGGAVPPQLLAKGHRARLTVELCEGCRNLTRDISKRCSHSEKLKMEIESGLKSMYGKIHQTDKTGRIEEFRKVMVSEWNSGMGSGMEILDVLRMETKQKCFSKINATSPRLHQKTVKILLKVPDSTPGQIEEPSVTNCVTKDDLKQNKQRENSVTDDFQDEIEESESGPDVMRHGGRQKDRKEANNEKTERTWTKNPDTGKYKCRRCPAGAEYATRHGVRQHYNTVHRTLRFKCKLCGKDFAQKSTYVRHHQSVHLKVRFQCKGCKKTFTRKGLMMAHQRSTQCAIGGK